MKVLFVCRGNVGRSQIAEAIFNLLADRKHLATSSGIEVGEHEGQALKNNVDAAEVLTVLSELTIDARNNTRTQLTQSLFDDADVIISMVETGAFPAHIQNQEKIQYWQVADPYKQSLDFTAQTRDQIKSLVENLLANIQRTF